MTESPTEQIADEMRRKLDDPVKDNRIRARTLVNKLDVTTRQAVYILKKMEAGEVDGVEIEVYDDSQHGGSLYTILAVDDDISAKFTVSAAECESIREMLVGGYTREEVAEELNLSVPQVRDHAKGRCSHDDGPRPVTAVRVGESYEWEYMEQPSIQ